MPILSRTLSPYTHTNLVIVENDGDYLIVDPGASEEGIVAFRKILESFSNNFPSNLELKVFVTHHHHDHIEALPIVASLFPKATLIAHPNTLARISCVPQMQQHPVRGGETIMIGGKTPLQVIESLGHTDGHMTLWERNSRTLIAGDHIVGFGSAVLDNSTNITL